MQIYNCCAQRNKHVVRLVCSAVAAHVGLKLAQEAPFINAGFAFTEHEVGGGLLFSLLCLHVSLSAGSRTGLLVLYMTVRKLSDYNRCCWNAVQEVLENIRSGPGWGGSKVNDTEGKTKGRWCHCIVLLFPHGCSCSKGCDLPENWSFNPQKGSTLKAEATMGAPVKGWSFCFCSVSHGSQSL